MHVHEPLPALSNLSLKNIFKEPTFKPFLSYYNQHSETVVCHAKSLNGFTVHKYKHSLSYPLTLLHNYFTVIFNGLKERTSKHVFMSQKHDYVSVSSGHQIRICV